VILFETKEVFIMVILLSSISLIGGIPESIGAFFLTFAAYKYSMHCNYVVVMQPRRVNWSSPQ